MSESPSSSVGKIKKLYLEASKKQQQQIRAFFRLTEKILRK